MRNRLFVGLFAVLLLLTFECAASTNSASGWTDVVERWTTSSARGEVTTYLCAWASCLAQKPSPKMKEAEWESRVSEQLQLAGFSAPMFPRRRKPRPPIPPLGTLQPDTQCFVTSTDEFVLVSFRGTEARPEDIVSDIRYITVPVPELQGTASVPTIKVHSGFRDALNDVWDELVQKIAERGSRPDGTPKQLWLTGHSLGGALATLAGWRLSYALEPREIRVYTYGSPRVGNAAFANDFQRRVQTSYRFVFNRDIVPRVPVETTLLTTYSHVKTEYYYDRDYKRLESGMDPITLPDLLSRGWTNRHNFSLLTALKQQGRLAEAILAGKPPSAEALSSLKKWTVQGVSPQMTQDHELIHYLRAARSAIPDSERSKWPLAKSCWNVSPGGH